MTKYGIAEQVISRLYPKGSAEAKASLPEVMLAAAQARDAMIRLLVFERIDQGQYSPPSECLNPYRDVETVFDTTMNKWYCVLPARVVLLPKDLGIFHVATMDCPDEAYIPTEIGANTTNIYGDGGLGRYYPEKNRLYFNRSLDGKKMFLRLVPRGQDVNPLFDFLFPSALESDLVDATLARFVQQKQIPEDPINNRLSE